jgi:hypothetical protein
MISVFFVEQIVGVHAEDVRECSRPMMYEAATLNNP